MSFTSVFPTNIAKFFGAGVKVKKYVFVCNEQLIYVELGECIDPSNHRRIYSGFTCTANNIMNWVNRMARSVGVSS